MNKLKLVIPNNSYKVQAQEYIEEFKRYKSNINGSGNLEKYNDYNMWLDFLNEMKLQRMEISQEVHFLLLESVIIE